MDNSIFKTRADYLELINKIYHLLSSRKKMKHLWFFIKIETGFFFHTVYGESKRDLKIIPKSSSGIFLLKLILKQPLRVLLFIKIQSLEKKLKSKYENKTLMIGYKKHNIEAKNYSIYLHPFLNEFKGEIFYLDNVGNDNDIQIYYNLLRRYYSLEFFFSNNLISEQELNEIDLLIENQTKINSSFTLRYLISKRINNAPQGVKHKKRFLKILNPKQVFCYCYYDGLTNEVLFAANELKINTIEYQHSSITDTHFAYAPWQDMDYIRKHFPNEYWVWRNEDAALIKKNFSGQNYQPIIKVVGNKYLEQSIANKKDVFNIKNNVLICLQGQWIPDFLEEFIKSDSQYNWYIRLHPRYPQDNHKLQELAGEKKTKLFINDANQKELYEIFQQVSIVITSFSGTAIEAEKFDKKVIIFGEEGYSSYKEKIEKGTYFFIDNFQTIKNSL